VANTHYARANGISTRVGNVTAPDGQTGIGFTVIDGAVIISITIDGVGLVAAVVGGRHRYRWRHVRQRGAGSHSPRSAEPTERAMSERDICIFAPRAHVKVKSFATASRAKCTAVKVEFEVTNSWALEDLMRQLHSAKTPDQDQTS
jgi:hypothetical protein